MALYNVDRGEWVVFAVHTTVQLRDLSLAERDALFARVPPLDKGGAYNIEEAPDILASLDGSRSNVIGLPLERLADALAAWGCLPAFPTGVTAVT